MGELAHIPEYSQLPVRNRRPVSPGRTPSDRGQAWQLTHLWEHHHTMKRLSILGWTPKEIANYLGMDVGSVRSCLNSEIMRREVALMRASLDKTAVDVAKKLQDMAVRSCDVLENILEDEEAPTAIRAKVALDVLSRAGHAPVTRVTGSIDHRHFTAEELQQIKARAEELKGEIIDVSYQPSEDEQ